VSATRCVAVDEVERLGGLYPHHVRWSTRAREPGLSVAQRLYAEHRARSTTTPVARRVARCASKGVVVRCGCGEGVTPIGCGQHLVCARCRERRWRRYGRRIRLGLEGTQLGRGEMFVLGTFTLRHSGDLDADWTNVMGGWRRFYQRLHRRGLAPRRYVGVVEVTPGRDGLGHVHLHVVMVWPWIPWSALHHLWRASCPQSTRVSFRESRHAARAAKYVSKYVSKGVDVSDWTPNQRGKVLAASYGRRWVFSSRRFWVPEACECKRCGALRVAVRNAFFVGEPDPAALAAFVRAMEVANRPDPHEILTTLVVDLRGPPERVYSDG
jgi:hypothetical protein